MAYEERGSKRSRVVVQTPTSHREVVETESTRTPDRSGISAGTVGVIVVLAVALVTILVLLLLSGQSTESTAGVAEQPTPIPQTTIVQQPAQQPPVVIQQAPAPAPVIITQPAPGVTRGDNDLAIETEIQKRFLDDPSLSALGISAVVLDGKVTLNGNVKTELEKAQAQRTVEMIKGVRSVDNQILVTP